MNDLEREKKKGFNFLYLAKGAFKRFITGKKYHTPTVQRMKNISIFPAVRNCEKKITRMIPRTLPLCLSATSAVVKVLAL